LIAQPPTSQDNGSKNLSQDLLTAEVEINDSAARYRVLKMVLFMFFFPFFPIEDHKVLNMIVVANVA